MAKPQKTRVAIDFPVRRQAIERTSGATIAVSAKGIFTIELQPQSTAMVDLGD